MADVAAGGDASGGAAPAVQPGRIGDINPGAQPPAPAPQRSTPTQGTAPGRPLPGDDGVAPYGIDDVPVDDGQDPNAQAQDDAGLDPNAPDDQQQQVDDDAPLFGLAPQELLAALRQGQLPDEMIDAFMNRYQHPVPQPDGRVVNMTPAEMAKGVMMRADYSRKTAEIAQVRKQAEGVIAREQQRQQVWPKNPEAMWNELANIPGMIDIPTASGALYDIAKHIAAQRDAWEKMSPPEQRAWQLEQQAEQRLAAAQQRENEINTRLRDQEVAAMKQTHTQNIAQHAPAAFQKYGINPSPRASKLFNEALLSVVNRIPDDVFKRTGVTPAICDEAAAITRDELRELAQYGDKSLVPPAQQQLQRGAPAQRPPNGLPPTALSGGRMPGHPPRTQPKVQRQRIGDFGALKGR